MKSLISLKKIAEHCYNAAEKEVVSLEIQIETIRFDEMKLSLRDEKRIQLRASRRIKTESLEYFKGLKVSYKIMLDAINNEIKLKEIEEAEYLIDMEQLERSNAIPVI